MSAINRRGFIGTMVGGVAASAAVRTWPFRVYSFPTDIQIVPEFPAWMYSAASFINDFQVDRDSEYWKLNNEFRAGIRNFEIFGPALFSDAEIAQADWA
jgi:hypothetical protein